MAERRGVGDPLGPWRFDRIERERMAEVSRIQHDPNPIHLDGAAVAAVGLGDRPINQGTANMGYVLNMLIEELSGGQLERVTVRLLANVFEGDRVVAAGQIESADPTPEGVRYECSVWLDVESGPRAVEGRAVMHVPHT